jgi:choline-sulfatase
LAVVSFTNPHDICCWGLWANLGFTDDFEFKVEEYVPFDPDHPGEQKLFDPETFHRTHTEDLAAPTVPTAQNSYQKSYHTWMQPILDDPVTENQYYRYYYQLHKNVEDQMQRVLDALLASQHYKDNTIVVFTSDHGELLGAHGDMHQKFYQAYEETVRVPLIIYYPQLFPEPRSVDTLTSHIDLAPTLLGLAGIDPEPIRELLGLSHSDAQNLVGRDLSPLILGQVDPASVNDPIYFMTDDDPSRGLNQHNWLGIGYNSVAQPNHVETVVARLDDGKVWKYSRYFDNPQFWSTPGYAGDSEGDQKVKDVVAEQKGPTPPAPAFGEADTADTVETDIPYVVTVKSTPKCDEFEMYNVTDDPVELINLYGKADYSSQQTLLAGLLEQQRAQKRRFPYSGSVPGQPIEGQPVCIVAEKE